jgi:hypothetical protein
MMVHPSYVSYHLSLPPSPQILGVDLLRHTLQLQVTYARARLRLHTYAAAALTVGDFLSETGVFLYFLLTILLGITYLRDTQS